MQTTLKVLIAAAALAAAWALGSPTAKTDGNRTGISGKTTTQPIQPIVFPKNGRFRGMAIQLHGGTDVFDHYSSLIPEVADLGADTILFVVHGWQQHAGTLDLHIDPERTASAEALGKLCDLAAQYGLRRIIMPVVLLTNPRNGEWRGKIVPPSHDWDTWFKRYQQFMVHFAKVAEKHKVEMLMVGSELIKTEAYTDRWQQVIAEVRQNYRGKLGYSSNWDHYQTTKIGFWPQLDFVGMTSYYKLADGPNPTIDEIDQNWARIRDDIRRFQQEVGKPIIFTEVGWCSQEGAAKEGWNYYANQNATEKALREQELLYESFMKTWSSEPYVGGVIWWEWDGTTGGKKDYNYTPRGKPAERLLRDWFADKFSPSPTSAPALSLTPASQPGM